MKQAAYRVLTCVFGAIAVYLVAAVIGAFVPTRATQVAPDQDTTWIILIRGQIHYDILLPVDPQTRAQFEFVQDAGVPLDHVNARWLSVGWGSEAFYTTAGRYRDISAGAVLRAATGDAGVIRFEVYGPLPPGPHFYPVQITMAQLDALRATIRADIAAHPAPLGFGGYTPTDAFFPAAGRFHVFRTCNVWIGRKLATAGLTFGAWTPTPYAVTLSMWWNGHLDTPSD